MENSIRHAPKFPFLDKTEIQRIIAQQNELMGLVLDPTATAEKARAMALAQGVKPEDNLGSCDIISARETE